MEKKIESFCKNHQIEFQKDILLSNISFFKTGGAISFLFYPAAKDQLKALTAILKVNRISYRVIGATSNIIFRNDIQFKFFISTIKLNNIFINKSKEIIEAETGVMMPDLVKKSLSYNFGGFEGLSGIPGTVGGGVYMNAGAYGNEISDLLISVTVLNDKNEFKEFLKDDLYFSWRHSIFHKKNLGIIVSAKFKGIEKNQENIRMKIKRNKLHRLTYQESSYSNVGSLFSTKDIYAELAKFNQGYKKKLYFVRKFYFYFKPTNNILLNYITCKHFNIDYKNRVFSDKTMNCLVNKGFPIQKYFNYIKRIQGITKNSLPLENIII